MLKKKILLITLLFCLLNLNAQENHNISLRIEPGLIVFSDSENLGLLLNFEPNIKISENTAIGLRFGLAINSQKFENNDSARFYIDDESDNAVISFVPTFDYYLNESNFRPYLGLGLGFYLLSDIDVSRFGSGNVIEVSVKNQLGLLLRGGFEIGNTRLRLEYNFIPKVDIEIPNNQKIGTVDNSYLGVSVGFKIGARKS